MRKIILTSVSILIFCVCSFGQNKEISPCPSGLSVTGPSGLTVPDVSQSFTANVSNPGSYPFKYDWSISGGDIIEGQGTSSIKVVQPSELGGDNLTATVELKGLPKHCESTSASETAVICACATPTQTDEFSGSFSQVKNENLDNFAKLLKENPTSQGTIIWYSKRNLSKNIVEQEIQKVTEYLTKEHNIEKARIVIKTSLFNKDLVTFFIVPAGASLTP